jgi:hypothetical protein
MKIYKISWNSIFYLAVLLSLVVRSFMARDTQKMNKNALEPYYS